MADGYWGRQSALYPSAQAPKRPRPDFDLSPGAPSGQVKLHYLPRDDGGAGHHALQDTTSIGASYDRYLQNAQAPSFGPGEASSFSGSGLSRGVGGRMPDLATGMHSLPFGDPFKMGGPGSRAFSSEIVANDRGMGFRRQLPMDPVVQPGLAGREMPLPPDASNTIFVDGLPRDSTQREVAHIFRPFLGYKEVRLVTKEPKYRDGDPIVLSFVDFTNAVCAMTAINALQGYKMDEHDPDSPVLRLQFSRNPGPKSGHGSRGKR